MHGVADTRFKIYPMEDSQELSKTANVNMDMYTGLGLLGELDVFIKLRVECKSLEEDIYD